MDNNKLETISNLFEGKEIRSIWDSEKEEYYFSVVDVVEALTDSNIPRNYWSDLKRKLKQALFFSLLIGIPSTILIFMFPTFFLKLLYKTSHGEYYIKKIAFVFILYYIEAPLSSFLQATNQAHYVMYDNFIGILIKTISLFILSFIPGIGLYSLLIASGLNILITTIRHMKHIKDLFKQKVN